MCFLSISSEQKLGLGDTEIDPPHWSLEGVSERGEGYLETQKQTGSDCVCVTRAADGMSTVGVGGPLDQAHSGKRYQGGLPGGGDI